MFSQNPQARPLPSLAKEEKSSEITVTWFENPAEFFSLCANAASKFKTRPYSRDILRQIKEEKADSDKPVIADTDGDEDQYQFILTIPLKENRHIDVHIFNLQKKTKCSLVHIYEKNVKLLSIEIDNADRMRAIYSKKTNWSDPELMYLVNLFHQHLKTNKLFHCWNGASHEMELEPVATKEEKPKTTLAKKRKQESSSQDVADKSSLKKSKNLTTELKVTRTANYVKLESETLLKLTAQYKHEKFDLKLKNMFFDHAAFKNKAYTQHIKWKGVNSKNYAIKVVLTPTNGSHEKTSYEDRECMSWCKPKAFFESDQFVYKMDSHKFYVLEFFQHKTKVLKTWLTQSGLGELVSFHKGLGNSNGSDPLPGHETLKLFKVYHDFLDAKHTLFVNAAKFEWKALGDLDEKKDLHPGLLNLPDALDRDPGIIMRLMEVLDSDETYYEKNMKSFGKVKLREGEFDTAFEGRVHQNSEARMKAIIALRQFPLDLWYNLLLKQSELLTPKLAEQKQQLIDSILKNSQSSKLITKKQIPHETILNNKEVIESILWMAKDQRERKWRKQNLQMFSKKMKEDKDDYTFLKLFSDYMENVKKTKLPEVLKALRNKYDLAIKAGESKHGDTPSSGFTIRDLKIRVAKDSKGSNPSHEYLNFNTLLSDGVFINSIAIHDAVPDKPAEADTLQALQYYVNQATVGSFYWYVESHKTGEGLETKSAPIDTTDVVIPAKAAIFRA